MTITPKGEEFLPRYSTEELTNIYKQEDNPKAKVRLLAAIMRKEGKNLEEIADLVKHPLTTVGDWLRRIHTEGISRRYNIKQTGRPKRLTDKQVTELKLILSKSPREQGLPFVMWTTKLVRHFIEQRYGVEYKLRQTRNILHKMGMSCKKPRPSHRRANKKLQEAFKKTSGRWSGRTLKMDMRSYFWTAASSQ